MNITETIFRNKKAVRITTKLLEAIVLPENGGKVGSLKVISSGLQLLKQIDGEWDQIDLTYDGDYCSGDVYAFDDMFPTIDPWDNGTRVYADHGEVIRLPWTYEIGEDRLVMSVKSKFGEYVFGKIFTETQDGRIRVDYSAENISDKDFPYLWAAHMMLDVQKGAQIDYERINDSTAEVVFSFNDFLGKRGTLIKTKRESNLFRNGEPEGATFKYYVLEPVEKITYGCFSLETRNAPYLGVWMNNGGFKNFKNVAIEVCTGGFDTPGDAKAHGHETILKSGEKKNWSIILGTV